MMSKPKAGKKISHPDSDNGKLLDEIEAISKALYPDRNSSRITASTATSRGKSISRTDRSDVDSVSSTRPMRGSGGGADQPPKDKKSFWNWKPLKALSQTRSRRFNCCFTLQVHKIENLHPAFNGASLCVYWKGKDGELVSAPAKVVEGAAEFEERLARTCAVHASRRGPRHSAKYEAKHFLLYAGVDGKPGIDLGKHRVDLTILLPLTFEELDGEKNSGKWTTTFKLQGKATGAVMNVSFGYLVLGDNPAPPPNNKSVLELLGSKQNEVTTGRAVLRGGEGGDGKATIQRGGSLPKDKRLFTSSRPVEDIKVLNQVFPVTKSGLSDSMRMFNKKFVGGKTVDCVSEPVKTTSLSHTDSFKENSVYSNSNVSVVEKGIEVAQEEKVRYSDDVTEVGGGFEVDSLDHAQIASDASSTLQTEASFPLCESSTSKKEVAMNDCSTCTKESLLEELEFALNVAEDLEKAGLETPEMESELGDLENGTETKSDMEELPFTLSDMQSAENEFLSLLGIEDSSSGLCSDGDIEPESPRERLLREFESEAEACGYSLFDYGTGGEEEEYDCDAPSISEWGILSEAVELPSISEFGEENQFLGQEGSYHAPRAPIWDCFVEEFEPPSSSPENEDNQLDNQECKVRPRAKVLEDLETEALMREWGLNEKAFESSPPHQNAGSRSSVDFQAEEPSSQLPPLGEGLSPFLQTENGGFLRSMNPSLFRNSKSGGSLIMQVSRPVVVPADMGSGVIEILESLASVGLEKLSVQANKLMPLEDINGKTMQQMAWEAAHRQEVPERHDLLQQDRESGMVTSVAHRRSKRRSSRMRSNSHVSSQASDDMASEFVSLEDLAPLAMDKIEALSVEGLRIQSGMSEEEVPSNIIAKSSDLEGAVGLQLLDVRDSDDMVDGLMGLSLTLDEWMRLDSGEIDEEELSERTSKVLAAHHATSTDIAFVGKGGDRKKKSKGSRGRCGLFGNNFTVALMVQLRDPSRDYEPVGTPMLTLIQVERVFVPPKPKIHGTVSELKSNDGEEHDEPYVVAKVESEVEEKKEEKALEEELIPQYKVAEVHVAGLKSEPGKKKLWGSAAQQQSGSRWLLANGMGKSNKHPLLKSNISKSSSRATTVAQSGDTLWSVSTRVHGTGTKWKELAALNPHFRNPNVVIPEETVIRLR